MLKLSLVINSHTNTFYRVKTIQFLRNVCWEKERFRQIPEKEFENSTELSSFS